MRFGMFIPQGWRLDLAGIDSADHWRVMRELAQAADTGPLGERVGVRPLPHRSRPD